MKNSKHYFVTLTVLTLLTVTPAMAEVFRVQLKNGNTFETRYRPKIAQWDENKVLLLTGVGNRISLYKDDIVSITSDTQAKGYGTVIDTSTIILGWAPNDAPVDSEPNPDAQFQQYLDSLRREAPVNTVQQFVNSEDAGGGGLSTWEFGASNFTGGPQGGGGPTVIVPPRPQVQPRGDGGGGDGS